MSVSSGIIDLSRAPAFWNELDGRYVVAFMCLCKPVLCDSLKSRMRTTLFLRYVRLPAASASYTVS